jgi:hypothetical protein
MITKTENERTIIGWREWVSLPGLAIPAVKVKIDTGARTSALHAFDMEVFEAEGKQKLRFRVRPLRKKKLSLDCVSEIKARRMVTDSGGHREWRYVIHTSISLGSIRWPIEITLTDRDPMRFRMLLGRKAIQGRFLVDPAQSYMAGRSLARAYSKKQPQGG